MEANVSEDPDKPVSVGPDDALEPIVESLLRWPLDSPEFADAAEVAGPAEFAEALRQIDEQTDAYQERQAWIDGRLKELEDDAGD
jgi:hypothetical protein